MYVQNLVVWLTEDCVLRCSYCFVRKKPKKMQPQTGKAAIDFLLDRRVSGDIPAVSISFFGGEPLMERDLLKELVVYGENRAKVAGKKLTFGATTNGTLFDADLLEFFRLHRLSVLFSMDGTPATTARHRCYPDGRSSYTAAAAAVPRLRRFLASLTARMTVHPDALNMRENAQHLFSLGFTHISMCPVTEADWNPDRLAELDAAFAEVAEWYVAEARKDRILQLNYINRFLAQHQSVLRGTARPLLPCGAGRGMLGVDTDGYLMPCHHWVGFPEFRLGTVHDGIDETARRPFFHYDSDSFHGCRECDVRLYCGGACLANCYEHTGDMFQPLAGHCHFTRARVRAVSSIYETLRGEDNQALARLLRTPGGPAPGRV